MSPWCRPHCLGFPSSRSLSSYSPSPSPPLVQWIVVGVRQIPRAYRCLQIHSLITARAILRAHHRAINRHVRNVDLGDLVGKEVSRGESAAIGIGARVVTAHRRLIGSVVEKVKGNGQLTNVSPPGEGCVSMALRHQSRGGGAVVNKKATRPRARP